MKKKIKIAKVALWCSWMRLKSLGQLAWKKCPIVKSIAILVNKVSSKCHTHH